MWSKDNASTTPDFSIDSYGAPSGLNSAKTKWKTWLGIDTIETTLNSLTNANGVSY